MVHRAIVTLVLGEIPTGVKVRQERRRLLNRFACCKRSINNIEIHVGRQIDIKLRLFFIYIRNNGAKRTLGEIALSLIHI